MWKEVRGAKMQGGERSERKKEVMEEKKGGKVRREVRRV